MHSIRLYGDLGAQFGRLHQYEVKSPAEAVRALCATIKGFKAHVLNNGNYRVIVAGKADIGEGKLHDPVSGKESIRIVPVVQGANGFGQILAGAALIALSFVLPGAGALAFAPAFSAAGFAGAVGASLVLSGVSQVLFAPKASSNESAERPENKPSFFFNGAVNTSRQGGAVPLCYGQMVVGSQVISSGLSVEQI